MDRFEAMAMLVEVVERGSLSAASRALAIPLPTLSRKISDLESLVGAKLLVRTTRRLTLTDAGAAYLPAAQRILEQVREAEREAAGELIEPKGELVVTAPLLFGRLFVLPIVTQFLERHPQIDVRLLLADRNVHLVDDQVDMAVRIGALADSSLVATRVGSMRHVVCASPEFIATYGAPQTPSDLGRLPYLIDESPMNASNWSFMMDGKPASWNFAHRPRLSVNTSEAAVEAARRGVGVVRLLHYQVESAIADGSLTVILGAYETPPVPIHVLHAVRGRMPLKMRRFLDDTVPRLRQRLAPFAA